VRTGPTLPLVAGLVAALVLGTAACTPAGVHSSSGTTLTIWDGGLLSRTTDDGEVDDQSFLHRAAADFEAQNPGVDVQVVRTSGDEAQFLATSIAQTGPDLRTGFTGGNTTSYADFLLDLDGTFSPETMADLSGWNTVREGYRKDGDLLALPFGAGSYFYVFYNKQLVADAGIDLSTPPATWAELLDLGQQVADSTDHNPFWVTNQEGYVGAWIIAALVGGELGGDAFTGMYTGSVPLDHPAMVRAYEAYAEMFERGLTNPDAGSVSNAELLSGFVQGKGAFMISGGWDNGPLYEAMGDAAGVFAIPVLEGARYPDTLAGGPNLAISITSYTDQPELAKDFLRYLARPESIDQYVALFQSEASNSDSADPSVITNPYLKAEAEQLAAVENTVFPFDNVMPQTLVDQFYRLNATTFTGRTSPREAVEQLQTTYESEVADQ
jgi:raffinose/stachyose/melibiose transport system substrate-binding protein